MSLPRFGYTFDGDDTQYFVVDPTMAQVADPADVVVSNGGRYVAFTARRNVSDPNSGRSVYTVDVTTSMITRVDPDGSLVTGAPSISDDGLTIAYDAALASSPDQRQIKVWDRTRRTNTVMSQIGGTQGNGPSVRPSISGDGHTIAFTTAATNLVPGMSLQLRHDGTGTEAVSLDRATGTITLLSHTTGDLASTAPTGNSWITGPDALSTDGTWAAFSTAAPSTLFDDTVTSDANNATDVIRRNRTTQDGRLISRVGNAACDGESSTAAVDDNGGVDFVSDCTDLPGIVAQGGGPSVFQSDGVSEAALINGGGALSGHPGAAEDAAVLEPSVNAAGDAVVWSTERSHDVDSTGMPPDVNDAADVYMKVVPWYKPKPPVPVEVPSPDIRRACPDTTRSVVTDFPDQPHTHVLPAVLADPSMRLAYTLTATQKPTDVLLPERVEYALVPDPNVVSGHDWSAVDPVRALVLEVPAPGGGSKFLVFDEGIEAFKSFYSHVPGSDLPINVALCAPALAAYGPKAFPDTASALTGTTVQLDVLANDEGDLDRSSLTVTNVSGGSAIVGTQDGLPQQPCVATDPAGDACVNLYAWNGDAGSEDSSSPGKVVTNLRYVGGVLRAAVTTVGSLNLNTPIDLGWGA